MDFSKLEPGLKHIESKDDKSNKEQVEELIDESLNPKDFSDTIDLPLADDETTEVKASVVTDPEKIKELDAKSQMKDVMVDAITKTSAQMRLEACENGVSIDSVYNTRIETLMNSEDLDEDAYKVAKIVVDNAYKVAKECGVPDKDDTDTIFALAQVATGDFNPREEIAAVKARQAAMLKSKITSKEKSKRRKKNKMAKKARKQGRKK